MDEHENDNEDCPIYGLEINDGIKAPFADLYYDTFPEWYDVE